MEGDVDRKECGSTVVEGEEEGEVDGGSRQGEQRGFSFRRYTRLKEGGGSKPSKLHVVVQRPLVLRLTKDIVETYQLCDPKFRYSEAFNPKRFLTTPHIGVLNEGFDNANSDLILSVNFMLINEGAQQRYIVKKMFGQGTFGQVVKCWIPETDNYVAVKVIKNQPAYRHQALHEVYILRILNQIFDPEDKNHIVRMHESFFYQQHLCISFETLGSNLFELLKMNQLKGLSLTLIQLFTKQMLQALVVLKEAGIIHCDLKPENILLCASLKPPRVKIIDFGSACMEGQTVYSYIQSRYYRSPEVVLGYPYTTAIDMWSFGCIVAELFLGLPLFPGSSEYDLLRRMIAVLGGQPPDNLLREAKNTSKYFKHIGSILQLDSHGSHGRACAYRLLTEEEYEAREHKKPLVGKWYFNSTKLHDIVNDYPHKKNLSEEQNKERNQRLALIDFLQGLIEFDPDKRWTPLQASGHPFVTGEHFTEPYIPPAMTSHIPVTNQITVDYGPGQGHWLAAGFSPQVSNVSRGLWHGSPHFTVTHFAHGSSFGSYNEATCPRGSYGSYGDGNSMYGYYSPGGRSGIPLHLGGSVLGTSPDARAVSHFPYGGGLGMSPTRPFGPMSLGISPSQFTPPSSQIQGSNISPGKFGPTSPARSGIHGSPLGKTAALGQYNRKRNLCPVPATVQLPAGAPQHWHGHHIDDAISTYPDANSRGYLGSRTVSSSHQSNWNRQRGSAVHIQSLPPPHPGNATEVLLSSSESSSDQVESSSSIPHPGDWDPNYSDELLLQENPDAGPIISGLGSMHLGPFMAPAAPAIDRSFNLHHPSSFSVSLNSSTDTQVQELSDANSNTPAFHLIHGQRHPISLPTHQHHFSQGSTSRFRQPPAPFSHIQSMLHERNHSSSQFSQPNYDMLDSHSSANFTFGSGTSWGHQAGHPFVTILPSSHAKR